MTREWTHQCADCAFDRSDGERLVSGVTSACMLGNGDDYATEAYFWRRTVLSSGLPATAYGACPGWVPSEEWSEFDVALWQAAESAARLKSS